jgi:hypothetical protein
MKKYFLGGIAMLAIAVAVAANISMNSQKNAGMSALSLANIEVLAGETSSSSTYGCTLFSCIWSPNYNCHIYGQFFHLLSCYGFRG